MKMWIGRVLAAALLLVSPNALATLSSAESLGENVIETSKPYMHINEGDWSVSLNGVGQQYGVIRGLFESISPRVEYFLLDRLSLGMQASVNYHSYFHETFVSMGPSATYHFWNNGNWSAYTGAAVTFNNLTRKMGESIFPAAEVSLGINYNFTPWFGLGPSMTARKVLTGNDREIWTTVELLNLHFYF